MSETKTVWHKYPDESEFTTLKFCRANVENLKMFLKEFEEYKQAGGSIDG